MKKEKIWHGINTTKLVKAFHNSYPNIKANALLYANYPQYSGAMKDCKKFLSLSLILQTKWFVKLIM